jgi:hypothetical protein
MNRQKEAPALLEQRAGRGCLSDATGSPSLAHPPAHNHLAPNRLVAEGNSHGSALGAASMTDARTFTDTLRGRWFGTYGLAACPICQPEQRRDQSALTITGRAKGGLLLHCKRSACAFRDILAAVGEAPGRLAVVDPVAQRQAEDTARANAAKQSERAFSLWREAVPICGTPAETYLRGRGITCDLPSTLRFHPTCWHPETRQKHPAMLALVEGCADFAVHRTYLRPDGSAKAAATTTKAMLGSVRGGAVRLCKHPGRLVVAEGIETALSLASGLLRGPATFWAALSTSGMRALHLPEEPGWLTIAPDGDVAGYEAARVLAERAKAAGWRVGLLPAPDGKDWNDVQRLRCPNEGQRGWKEGC